MKLKSLLVLAVLFVSVAAPFKLQIYAGPNSKAALLFTLDVCHASDASLSVNTDSPSLYECPCTPPLPQFDGFYEKSEPAKAYFLLSFQKERPPKV